MTTPSSVKGKQNEKHAQHIARNVLITPSASPPVSRPMDPPLRAPDTAPLAKRPRLTATPSSSSSSTPLSFHTPTYDADVQDARRASSRRVLNAWAQLAERYNRRLDEDDVVDLWSGTIIKDRGVLRGTAQHDIGRLSADDPSEPFGEDHDQNDQEDDDEVDPSVPEPDISQTFVAERISRQVPPMRGMESADAEDLNEFLEAERKRQDLYAEEDYMSNEDLATLRKVLAEQDKDNSDKESEDGNATERGETRSEGATKDDADASSSSDIEIMHMNFDAPTDDESEDELGVWERDEASAVYQISRNREQEDISRIENEVIDLSDSPTPSPPPTPPPVPVPGRSATVSRRSIAPKKRIRSKSRGKSKSRVEKSREREHIPVSPPRQVSPILDSLALQLQTPPRSSSFLVENPLPQTSPKVAFPPPLEVPPLSPEIGVIMDVGLPPPVLEAPAYKATPMVDLLDESKKHRSSKKATQTPSKTPKKPSKSKLIPEVVIIRKSTSGKFKKQVAARDKDSDKEVVETSDDAEAEAMQTTPAEKRISAKDKGKGRELRDTPVVPKVIPVTKESAAEEPADEDFVNGSPPDTHRLPSHPPETVGSSLRGRKRKRVPSPTHSEPLEDPLHNTSVTSPVRESPPLHFSNSRPPSPNDHDSHKFQYQDRHVEREHRHFSSRAPSIPLPTPVPSSDRTASPYYSYPYSQPYSTPHHPSTSHPYTETPQSYPPPHMDPMQTQHAQYLLAQAMHHLSFLMSSNGHPGPGQPSWMQHPAPPPAPYAHSSYPPPPLHSPPPWPPYTPTQHLSHQSRSLHNRSDSSSSSIPFMHPNPVPAQSFSNIITPSSSQATLPPSSPRPLSPAISTGDGEVIRPKSLVRGRSKSRGRRVSFVLDEDHRPHSNDSRSASAARGRRRYDSPVDELDSWATEDQSGQDMSDKGSRPLKAEYASHRSQSSVRRVVTSSMDEKSKGTKHSQVVTDDESSTPVESCQRIERGRTPGPPNRHEVSEASALPKRGRSRSVVAMDKPSRAKK